jgi:RNA polymerase sigma-70 factor (sigma-E family)
MRVRPEFEDFVHASSARLLRTGYLLTGNRLDAEDLLQTTLMRVARHWGAAETAPGPYATRVLINLSRDRARMASRRLSEAPLDEAGDPAMAEDDLSDQVARRALIMAGLAQLADRQREVLVLRYYADLSVEETAAATGTSAGTVKSHTSRALTHMRELLAEPDPMEVSPDER